MILNRLSAPGLTLLFVAGSAVMATAATPVIGMASAQSGATLDNNKVSGNTTVFEGSTLLSSGYSRVHLNNGARLDLAAGSKAQLFANHVSLEAGMSEVQSSTGFEIDARTLKIQPTSSTSIARVKLDADRRVYVTALNSPVNVLNKDGMLVARVAPGSPLSFLPQTAAEKEKADKDKADADKKKAAGAGAAAGAAAGAGAAATAGGVAGAAAAIGISTTARGVGGVAVAAAAAVGGAAAAGSFSSNSP